jgi:hypothetical protein
MLSSSQIITLLSFDIDPRKVEDWLANREVFGMEEEADFEEKECEAAYKLEEALTAGAAAGFCEQGDCLVVAPAPGKGEKEGAVLEVEFASGGRKPRKITAKAGETGVFALNGGSDLAVKAICRQGWTINGQAKKEWRGKSPERLIVDTRGGKATRETS